MIKIKHGGMTQMYRESTDENGMVQYRGQVIQVEYLEGLGEWVTIGVSFEEDCDRDHVLFDF